ncbi:tetratricopeptide repeat protein [Actinomadura sp. K4S16]|uniref:tetratricopeptide repeat protein n=1 Tax=Actinomadura sp. K4S16 TaxID=1316147 RepID=UPI0011ECA7EA|nr:tetratricopeptide repeat protein [Actinomadura sp. K4S16]
MEATASGDGRVYQAARDQYIDERTIQVRPASEVPAPPGLLNLPAHADLFVGRESELTDLDAALRASEQVVVAAVSGLGGVGKSTLAARYALTHARPESSDEVGRGAPPGAIKFHPVWWITADTQEAVQAGLAGMATALQPELTEALPLEALAEWALTWLGCHSGWLLVLDNVTDPAHIVPLLERTRAGRFLVTSRLGQGWHRHNARVLRLDVLTPDQALELLTRIATTNGWEIDPDGADELVAELGFLPLAIEQAGAFINQNQLPPRAYLELLAASPAMMYDLLAEGGDTRTIARIWRITVDRLTADTPLAGDLLRVLAWYAPEAIPRSLLDGLTRPHEAENADATAGAGEIVEAPLLQAALGKLAAYNMITLTPGTITVHRLVQALARTPDDRPGDRDPHRSPEAIITALHTATRLLDQARPADVEDPSGWPRWRQLLPHIDALADHAPLDTDSTRTSLLLDRTATFLQNQGVLTRAIAYFERALTTDRRLRGDDHFETLASRNNLAYAYRDAGDLTRAIPLHEQTLTDYERVLGHDHPDTLTARNNLANAYQDMGDLERAIQLHEQTLADRERVLGHDHPDSLSSRNNLAYAYRDAGDLTRAIPLHEQTLADRERVLGHDHPDTLTARNNLASAYQDAGDLERAIQLHVETLADRERILGAHHPDTLASRNNLAYAYQDAGDLERAIPPYQQTLADCERVLGTDHPYTLSSRNNLANAYQKAGHLGRAIPLYEQTLADRERVLGHDHPDTLTVRNNLASAYQDAGDLERAIQMYEQTLADCERVLSKDHPMTEIVRANLESATQQQGGQ